MHSANCYKASVSSKKEHAMQDLQDTLMDAAQNIAATGMFTANDTDETLYCAVADAVCEAIVATANSKISVEELRSDLDYYVNKELA